jgi:predicted short-subunit dehydrogenase-like oxidoreductase (DUF2520 family)
MNIVILGSGNVATLLGTCFLNAGYNISQVWSRNVQHAEALASLLRTQFTDDIHSIDQSADLYIIAVSDDAIEDLVAKLGSFKGIVVHTSGSTSIEIFNNKFENYGVFYPFQTFSKGRDVDFKIIPILLEASNSKSLEILNVFANSISNRVRVCNSEQRKALHIAAVFACNFTNRLYTLAQKLLEDYQLDFDLLRPLISETAQKVQEFMPKEVQTGPAIRNDEKIINSHLKQLETHQTHLAVYKLLTEQIISESSKK